VICDALAGTGQVEAAYRLLATTDLPSWLYPVTMGATTVWERWDSMLPDGSINPGEMTSFNHYALGAVVDFLHRWVGGLAPGAPGYRVLRVAPRPGGTIVRAEARLQTPYGAASSSWSLTGARFSLEVTVPVGVTAEVSLPDGSDSVRVGSGTHVFHADLAASGPGCGKDMVSTW
jgi:alpha-L-rhamnosidase